MKEYTVGVLDQILKEATGGQGEEAAKSGGLAEQVIGMLQGKGGGLPALMQAFHAKGLGDMVKSWVGTGPNDPVTPSQLDQVFGMGRLREMAAKAGLSADDFKTKLAKILPTAVDQLTPDGELPDAEELERNLGVTPKKG
jgi:uncharacterized protein YidB (DUF937 family)